MELFLGRIVLFPYHFAPLNFALCDGATLPISQHQDLYRLLGTQYGGDGHTTFKLPDFRGKGPDPHIKYYIYMQDNSPQNYPQHD